MLDTNILIYLIMIMNRPPGIAERIDCLAAWGCPVMSTRIPFEVILRRPGGRHVRSRAL
jgi:hypothetical protein